MATTTVMGLTLTLTPTLLSGLRLAPFLSTTASLTQAYMEWLTTSSFIHPTPMASGVSKAMLKSYTPTTLPVNMEELDAAKEKAAPAWFVNFFNQGVWSVIGLNSITLLSTTANLFLFPGGLGQNTRFYAIGLAAAVAHYAFVPLVAPSVERLFKICAAQEKGEEVGNQETAVESIREWVGYHKIRMCSVDLVAWMCFAVGAVAARDMQSI
ncbi:Nn.00g111160.m01.CDS01 [Neocucurbitaria sp. VM-36]